MDAAIELSECSKNGGLLYSLPMDCQVLMTDETRFFLLYLGPGFTVILAVTGDLSEVHQVRRLEAAAEELHLFCKADGRMSAFHIVCL